MTISTKFYAIVSMAVMAAWVGSSPPAPMEDNTDSQPRQGSEACPQHEALLVDDNLTISMGDTRNELVQALGATARSPIWHDCQRFIDYRANPAKFGPLMAIFAVDAQKAPFPLKPDTAVTIAVIYNYSDSEYQEMGIQPKFNCLYVASQGPAWIVSTPKVTDCVPKATSTLGGNPKLNVSRNTIVDLDPDDYIRFARWDTDPSSRHYYIQISCDKATWCRMHAHWPLTPSPSYPAYGSNKFEKRRWTIKGYYDEQTLAVRPDATPELVPAKGVGTTVPMPRLDALTRTDFLGSYTRVGSVFLEGAGLSMYRSKFGLGITGPPTALDRGNTVEICYQPEPLGANDTPCEGADQAEADQAGGCQISLGPKNEKEKWFSRVTAPGGSVKYLCIKRTDHSADAVPPPPASRWRWVDTDELLWYRCGLGCCEVQ